MTTLERYISWERDDRIKRAEKAVLNVFAGYNLPVKDAQEVLSKVKDSIATKRSLESEASK